MAENGWISTNYENARLTYPSKNPDEYTPPFPPDRQKLIYDFFKAAAEKYVLNTGNNFPGYNMRNLMKFSRNYALINR